MGDWSSDEALERVAGDRDHLAAIVHRWRRALEDIVDRADPITAKDIAALAQQALDDADRA